MFVTFDYLGLGHRTSILDGGLDRWKAENRAVTMEASSVSRTGLTIHPRPSVVVDAEWLRRNLEDPAVAVVDARDRRFYDGNGGGVVRTGHIKGARSVPFWSLVDSTNRLLDREALLKVFAEAGVPAGSMLVTYCHVGQQASFVYAVAQHLGWSPALYDGSFQDWNIRGDEYPVYKINQPVK
jgi:thiosulfate/3-mercaptopyruvate sulfurtransferase